MILYLFYFPFSGLVFNENYNDNLYIIQNGSLLRIDANFESFDVYEHYCLDMDEQEGILTAIVCEFDETLFRVNQAQAFIFATCMFISVPVNSRNNNKKKCVHILISFNLFTQFIYILFYYLFYFFFFFSLFFLSSSSYWLQCLLLTVTLYMLVPELNDLHGKSLAFHSISLSLGFLLLALSQFRDMFLIEGNCTKNFFFLLTFILPTSLAFPSLPLPISLPIV